MEEQNVKDVRQLGKGFWVCWTSTWQTFEQVRCEIFNQQMAKGDEKTNFSELEAKIYMQKAYFTYAIPSDVDGENPSPFAESVTDIA